MLFGYKILVFCTSKIFQDRFCDFISGLNDALMVNNWRIMIFSAPTDLYHDNINNQGAKHIFDLINYDIADAMLISEDSLRNEQIKENLIKKAKDHNLPVIMTGSFREDTYNINFNEQAGFEHIVRHIIDVHHKTKIHFMAGTAESRQSNERLDIMKKVMEEKKLPFDDSNVSYGDFWDLPARQATQALIDCGDIPEAIICANDTMAITVISVLQQNGYDCPDEVLVTGFDGIQGAFFSNPKITTSLCDYNTLGIETAKFIQQISENKIPLCTKYIDSSLILSESCGCKPLKPHTPMSLINFLTDSYNRYRVEDSSLMNISVAIQSCNSLEEVRSLLKNDLFYNVMCLVKTECIAEDANPNIVHTSSTYGEVQYILLDSDYHDDLSSDYIKTVDLIPRMQSVLDNYHMPLIFAPLSNMNQPIGYLCFCFCNYDKQNYAKVSQIASWMSNAITGYRNMQYQRELQKQIESMYSHDNLTGLYNRIGFQRIYKQVLNNPDITTISLCMCDLDNLKFINDNFTHNEGDSAINTVGQALSHAIPDGYFCRYGGDELIGLYPYEVDAEKLTMLIEGYLEEYNMEARKPYEVSTSIGVYTSFKTSFEEMFGKADKLMYLNKMAKKRNRENKH